MAGSIKIGILDWRTRPQGEARSAGSCGNKDNSTLEANNSEYGYRRIHAALVRGGESVDDGAVCKIIVTWDWSHAAEALAVFAD